MMTKKLKKLVMENRRVTIIEVAEDVGMLLRSHRANLDKNCLKILYFETGEWTSTLN